MKWLAVVALVVAGACWGVGLPLGKLAMREIPAGHMLMLRFALAAVAASPFALARRETRALFRSPPVVTAGVLYGLGFLAQFEGLAGVRVALAALLVGALPALIAVFARLTGERLNGLVWGGVASATLGALLIAGRPEGAGTPVGIGLSILALGLFLGWLVALKRAPDGPTPLAVPAVTILVAALTIAPVVLLLHGWPDFTASGRAWAGVAGQGLFSTLLATVAWQYGSSRVGSATAGVFINIEPLLGAALGVVLFGDRMTPGLLIGGAMILLGSLAVVIGEHAAASALAHDAPATPG